SSRQGEQSWPVGDLEIVDVTAVRRLLGARMQFADHFGDGAAAAGAGKSAHEDVVAGGGQLHAHFQGAQSAVLSDQAFAQLGLRRGLKRQARWLAAPAEFFDRQSGGLRTVVGRFAHTRRYSNTGYGAAPEPRKDGF